MEEQFDIYNAQGQWLGTKDRSQVHRDGDWHKSAQVFLYHSDGRLLLHQRAHDKDLYAGLWDHSVGEHLQPGEDYPTGAMRGVNEELGLQGLELTPLGTPRQQSFKDPAGFWWDCELQQSYRATYQASRHGNLQFAPQEITAIAWVDRVTLLDWIEQRASQLTPWFEQDLRWHGLLPTR